MPGVLIRWMQSSWLRGGLRLGTGGLIGETENCFEEGDAPPAVVAVHLPESFGETGVERVEGMFEALSSGDGDRLAVHGQAHLGRSIVIHQGSDGATVTVVGGDEV